MRPVPENGLVGRACHACRTISKMRVPVYAGNASFFIVLSVFPGLVLVLGVLIHTDLDVGQLVEIFQGVLPKALLSTAEDLIRSTYSHISGAWMGFSALTAVWSASRGTYGVITGLNGIYGVSENRGYIFTRCISVLYTFAFFAVLMLTLVLHVFGTSVLGLLGRLSHPAIVFLMEHINLRFFLLLFVQTGLFTAMFMVLPNGRHRFMESLPGALLASCGWLIFSDLYSIYVERFATLSSIYGSIYAGALSMLWLYFCISIVFYGGALNVYIQKCIRDGGEDPRQPEQEPSENEEEPEEEEAEEEEQLQQNMGGADACSDM